MGNFINITWRGEEYTLNETEAFLAADAVERHITIGALSDMRQNLKELRLTDLAKAYSALLSEAGAKGATPMAIRQEFTAAIRGDGGEDGPERVALALGVIDQLLILLMDGAPIDDEVGDKKPKNAKKGKAQGS